MKRLLFFLGCLSCAGAQAQTITLPVSNTLDAYWNIPLTADQRLQTVLVKSQTAILDPTSSANSITLQQNGAGNTAILQTPSGSQNRLDVYQGNNSNIAVATLSGINNSLLIGQTGGGNITTIDMGGINNRFLITQDGGDIVNMHGLQRDNTRLELSQKSGANSFTLDNSTLFTDPLSQGIPNLRIEQSGGASVTIQQGRVIGN